MSSEPPPEEPAELVGATEHPVELTGGERQVELSVGTRGGPSTRRARAEAERVYLAVEGIEGDGPPELNYAVYLNLPDGADPDDEPDRFYAGTLSLFGLERTRRVDADPGGHPLRAAFDITELVADLQETQRWDPAAVTVTFVPLLPGRGPRRGSAGEEHQRSPVTVGRIGFYRR